MAWAHWFRGVSGAGHPVTGDGQVIPALDQPFVPKDRKKDWRRKWTEVWKPFTM